jgi:UDP-N-acetylglucosamine/UDP-N-acetylgalactosamine diphosphorylase
MLPEELETKLKHFQQEHLWQHLLSISDKAQQEQFIKQLKEIDFDLLQNLYNSHCLDSNHSDQKEVDVQPLAASGGIASSECAHWQRIGEGLLADNKIAVFLVAGGQGSRLGFDGPKGIFDIGLPSAKSLFQLQAERILNLEKRFQCTIPWYIMTSPLNDKATRDFFEGKDFFGLKKENIFFFPQGMIPALDENAKVLLSGHGELALVPDGNGGCFKALDQSGALDDMKERGIEYLFFYSVDNAATKIADPLFMGFLADSKSASASKVIPKRSPDERVGIFASLDGKPGVIEYSDLSEELQNARLDDGSLLFDGGNIAIHAFRLDALEKIKQQQLPYHVAHKKVSYFDTTTQTMQTPSSPNSWKFEQFLFDAFPILGEMQTFIVKREEEFAPVKNADGLDSPKTARELLGKLHKSWLAPSPEEDSLVEISPLDSYAGEGITQETPWQSFN